MRGVYHGLVTSVCDSGQDYGFCCYVIDALDHIKSVAKEDDRPERYDPMVYLLIATAQFLNPIISSLCEILVVSHVDVNTRQKFDGYKKTFLRYQLKDPAAEEEVTPPPGKDIEDHRDTAYMGLEPHAEFPLTDR